MHHDHDYGYDDDRHGVVCGHDGKRNRNVFKTNFTRENCNIGQYLMQYISIFMLLWWIFRSACCCFSFFFQYFFCVSLCFLAKGLSSVCVNREMWKCVCVCVIVIVSVYLYFVCVIFTNYQSKMNTRERALAENLL